MQLVVCLQAAGVAIYGGTTTFTNVNIHDNEAQGNVGPYHDLKPPHRPDETLTLCLHLQGGGVYISGSGAEVSFEGCNIYNNEARYVRTICNHPNAPMRRLLTRLPRFACAICDQRSYQLQYVRAQRLVTIPSPRWEALLTLWHRIAHMRRHR